MIKFIFEGDIEETWRLLEMITKSVQYEFIEPLRTVEDYARRNLEYQEEIDKLNSIISDLQAENSYLQFENLYLRSVNSYLQSVNSYLQFENKKLKSKLSRVKSKNY